MMNKIFQNYWLSGKLVPNNSIARAIRVITVHTYVLKECLLLRHMLANAPSQCWAFFVQIANFCRGSSIDQQWCLRILGIHQPEQIIRQIQNWFQQQIFTRKNVHSKTLTLGEDAYDNATKLANKITAEMNFILNYASAIHNRHCLISFITNGIYIVFQISIEYWSNAQNNLVSRWHYLQTKSEF